MTTDAETVPDTELVTAVTRGDAAALSVLYDRHAPVVFRAAFRRLGDRLDLPARTLHAADVGPDGVRCLEAHLPAGSLHPEPRRMADWATTGSAGAGRETDGDRET